MKRITPERNLYGRITGYTVSDVSEQEIEANGTVANWYMKLSVFGFLLIVFPPLFILLSPVLYFVSKRVLREGGDLKHKKLLTVVNKITFAILIYWIASLAVALIGVVVFSLHYFEIIDVPFLDLILEHFKNL